MSKAEREINETLQQHLGRIEPHVGKYQPSYFRSEESAGCTSLLVSILLLTALFAAMIQVVG